MVRPGRGDVAPCGGLHSVQGSRAVHLVDHGVGYVEFVENAGKVVDAQAADLLIALGIEVEGPTLVSDSRITLRGIAGVNGCL